MTCGELDGMLDRLMDGVLSDDERRAMEAHGQSCPACAEAIRATTRMKALFDEMEPEADVPLEAQAKWRGAVREAAAQKRRRRLIRWAGSAAAALVVLAGVGLALNTRGAKTNDAKTATVNAIEAPAADDAGADAAYKRADAVMLEALDEAPAEAAGGTTAQSKMSYKAAGDTATEREASADAADGYALTRGDANNGIADASEGDFAVMSPADEAMEAAGETALEYFEDADDAFVETDGESAPMCAALAQRAPACELRIKVRDLDGACNLVCDLAAEYEGEADVQRLEDGGANIYVEVAADNARDFLDGLQSIGATDGPSELPEDSKATTVLMLLALYTEN